MVSKIFSKMNGCADGVIVYGWSENVSDRMIASEWLEEQNINSFPMDLVRGYAGYFVYGVQCKWDRKTGQATVASEEKKKVEDAAEKAGIAMDKLEFYLAVTGDYETCHEEYLCN